MFKKTFHEPFWLTAGKILPGALAVGVWTYMAWQIEFEPVVSAISAAVFLPFVLLSLWLYLRQRRRRIRCDTEGIEYRRGKQEERIAWADVRDFSYDLAGDGRRRLLLYEVRDARQRIRFHRSPGRSETDFEEFSADVTAPEIFSRATWSFRSRGLLLSRRRLRRLRALIEERTGRTARRYPGLLQRPEAEGETGT